jgi:hypothetical protein
MHGVVPMVSSIVGFVPTGIRYFVLAVDPRAHTVVVTLEDGETFRIPAVALPATLHRSARVAWAVTSIAISGGTVTPQQLNSITVRRAVAYDRRHHVVGTFTERR